MEWPKRTRTADWENGVLTFVWYSQEEKIVSTQPRPGYQEIGFASLEEWFNFIQDLTKDGYRIT